MRMTRGAHSYGLASLASDGTVLDVWFPCPELDGNGETGTSLEAPDDLPDSCDFFAHLIGEDADRGVHRVGVRTDIADLDEPPVDAYDRTCACTCCPPVGSPTAEPRRDFGLL